MRPSASRPGIDTLVQCAPPSRVSCTTPSSVATQICLAATGEGATASSVPNVSAPVTSSVSPPVRPWRSLRLRVRSGLIGAQCRPASVLRNSTLPPAYTARASCGSNAIGVSQLKRYFSRAGATTF